MHGLAIQVSLAISSSLITTEFTSAKNQKASYSRTSMVRIPLEPWKYAPDRGSSSQLEFIIAPGGGRVVRRCWVNFQCRGVLLTWITVGQGPIVLAVGAGGGCLDIFSLIFHFSFLSPSLWETARYRLKYCLKGPLSQNNKPTNHHSARSGA